MRSAADFDEAVAAVGLPAVLKTASWGYDGKGQVRVESAVQVRQAWYKLGAGEAVLESWIDFAGELSVVAARGLNGEVVCYDPITNFHRHHVLDVSLCQPMYRRT